MTKTARWTVAYMETPHERYGTEQDSIVTDLVEHWPGIALVGVAGGSGIGEPHDMVADQMFIVDASEAAVQDLAHHLSLRLERRVDVNPEP